MQAPVYTASPKAQGHQWIHSRRARRDERMRATLPPPSSVAPSLHRSISVRLFGGRPSTSASTLQLQSTPSPVLPLASSTPTCISTSLSPIPPPSLPSALPFHPRLPSGRYASLTSSRRAACPRPVDAQVRPTIQPTTHDPRPRSRSSSVISISTPTSTPTLALMPSASHLGMGSRSRSSPSLSNNSTSSSSTAAATAAAAAASSSPAEHAESPRSPAQSSSPAPSTNTSSRPSFLSRLSLPLSLRSRNRNVTDFHIRPEEPHRRYSAGDHVRGSVVLAVVKPVRITHLVVSLHGYVRVLKDPTSIAKTQGATVLPQGGGSMQPRYHNNGLASLFQDEQVLSGEGRLEPGKYEFGFDLVFPKKGLPSSIDFERGTVSYNITATITRPTSINPTSSCDRKVMLVENVDIGLLPAPPPRTIFLEPISKRTRRKKSIILDKASMSPTEVTEIIPDPDSVEPTAPGASDDSHDPTADARSPIPSDVRSEVSGESASTGVSRNDLALSQIGTLTASAKQQAVDKKTITATVELLRGGCLPGDAVTVRISVQHIKHVKSMSGIIVTLYRQGKIDSSPPASLFSDEMTKEDIKRVEREDVYPRSRTGLGGLSLSSSGSTSMFRKDLDQNTAPLIMDPTTLQTSVTVSVKLPDDSFPTIKSVPGEMISFKYLVEVVVDLGGRLANQLQGGPSSRFGSFGHGNSEPSPFIYGPRRGINIADTSQLRREKGVISVSMETLVGTTDSSRGRKRSRASPSSRRMAMPESDDEDHGRTDLGYVEEMPYEYHANGQLSPTGYFPAQMNGNRHPQPHILPPQPYSPLSPSHPSQHSPLGQGDFHTINGFSPPGIPAYVPPPQIPEQNELSEKERIRQAETRLLPSAPPTAGPSNSNDDDNIYDAEDTPRAPPLEARFPPTDVGEAPSAPSQDEIANATAPPADQLEDKQEQERRRLMNEASAPPEFPDDVEQRNSGPSRREMVTDLAPETEPSAPSAPLLDDLDDFPGIGPVAGPSGNGSRGNGEQLPAYQR
ncbi:hypothetical protein G7Z17_g11957 [Cylindrodendrum hubeiense]|uniref:Arrestin C-terminal-like domain-containing protein n=1 Tax=Cylindrodendrum hubeiense TaxID=595255 RepID=A0A9P5GZ86_9HYPO|nr:hypothetical protein G7Z17_g11957 [Cylindrodendrum hubeiense]